MCVRLLLLLILLAQAACWCAMPEIVYGRSYGAVARWPRAAIGLQLRIFVVTGEGRAR